MCDRGAGGRGTPAKRGRYIRTGSRPWPALIFAQEPRQQNPIELRPQGIRPDDGRALSWPRSAASFRRAAPANTTSPTSPPLLSVNPSGLRSLHRSGGRLHWPGPIARVTAPDSMWPALPAAQKCKAQNVRASARHRCQQARSLATLMQLAKSEEWRWSLMRGHNQCNPEIGALNPLYSQTKSCTLWGKVVQSGGTPATRRSAIKGRNSTDVLRPLRTLTG